MQGSNYICPSCFHLLRRRCFAPDGFDAVSVQNVGSTYTLCLGTCQLTPSWGPPDPESDTNDIVISLFINKIINPDKSFGSFSDPMCILLLQLSSLLVEHTAPNIHDSKCLGA
ncbi:hypothetical protein EMCRGX_G026558 [Ephydatia muelleri]